MDTQPVKRRRLNHVSLGNDHQGTSTSSSAITTTPNSDSKEPLPMNRNGNLAEHKSNLSRSSRYKATTPLDGSVPADLFKLQLDELLGRLTPKYETKMAKADGAIHQLRTTIEAIPDQRALSASEAQKVFEKSSNICIPFPRSVTLGSKVSLAYAKPTSISVVGSYARRTSVLREGKVTIDLAVTMPSSLFHAKDYRDHRYFHKRAYYLACIAAGIQKAQVPALDISFAYQDDNLLQPVIIAQPRLDGNPKIHSHSSWKIRILLVAGDDTFPLEKTLPTKSCIKDTAAEGDSPTPRYNATLRSECSSSSCLKELRRATVRSSAFQNACMLGAIWLRQRGLGSSLSAGGFGQFEWAALISILMRDGGRAGRPILPTGYSSYQLFKATLQFLSSTDLISSPMVIQSPNFKLTHTKNPMLFDGSRGMNVLYKMSSWSYQLLQTEARNSLKALNDPLADHFRILFINKVEEPLKRFDHNFRIPFDKLATENSTFDDVIPNVAEILHEKFSYGLANRATLVYPQIPSTSIWPIDSRASYSDDRTGTSIGLLLDPEHCLRTVDRGPSIEDKMAAAAFRKFWGDKAELRRFKDGTIMESLIWDASNSQQSIIGLIINHILSRHFGVLDQESSGADGEVLARLLPQYGLSQSDVLGPFSAVKGSFESLCKSIRAMEGLPLQIRQIFAASPELRYASLYAPVAGKQTHPAKAVECLIQFEGSTRWPDDLFAVQRTKIAFLLKIADAIGKSDSISAVRLRLEKSKRKLFEQSYLDLKTPDGIIFRLQIYHEHELSMLEKALNGRIPCPSPKEEIALAIAAHKRNFIHRPAHTQAVTALSTRFPILSPTIRLLKKWRDSHLLSPHLADELLELLAIRTFIHPYPWPTPGSLLSAFLRTLHFIAGWDWPSEPLILDFNAEFTAPEIQSIRIRFDAWRKLDPGMNRVAMFVASGLDREGIAWTDRRPAKMIASRFTNLARAACELVKQNDGGLALKPDALFVPSLLEYDIIIYLKPSQDHLKKTSSFKNLQVEEEEAAAGRRGADPFDAICDPRRLFVDELQELYGEDIVFFYNESAAITLIAGLWNPQTEGPRKWKVGLRYSSMPLAATGEDGDGGAEEEEQVTINKAAVLHDIARLGGDLIVKIDQK